MDKNGIDFETYFLGPKGENADLLEELIMEVLREHIYWRRNFQPQDPFGTTAEYKHSEIFIRSKDRLRDKLWKLLSDLKRSAPFFSPRYLAHMTSDVSIPAIAGYFATMLFNPNNVAYEGSPVTTLLELEVGKQLAKLMSYDPETAWGHITSCGTVANLEALWIARNLKYEPLCVKNAILNLIQKGKLQNENADKIEIKYANGTLGKILEEKNENKLLNHVSVKEAIELRKKLCNVSGGSFLDIKNALLQEGIENKGLQNTNLGKVFIAATRHYSWDKIAGVLGLGREAIVLVNVNRKFRMDINDLESKILQENGNGNPILAVIVTVGSTEESAIDPVHEIINLRKKMEKNKNLSFYIHIDAAWGGYFRSIFFDENGNFVDQDKIRTHIEEEMPWPDDYIWNAYNAFPEAESITVDPHKTGYVPYPAGGIVFKHKEFRELVLAKASYAFKEESGEENLGQYILEGSKPGAAAASVWLSHDVLPLNLKGHGALLIQTIKSAHHLQSTLWHNCSNFYTKTTTNGENKEGITITFTVTPIVVETDLNIVCYVFNWIYRADQETEKANVDLKRMNELNNRLAERMGYKPKKHIGAHAFMITKTTLKQKDYEDAPLEFLEKAGIENNQWNKVGKVEVLRSTAMNPYLNPKYVGQDYVDLLRQKFKETLEEIINELPTSNWK